MTYLSAETGENYFGSAVVRTTWSFGYRIGDNFKSGLDREESEWRALALAILSQSIRITITIMNAKKPFRIWPFVASPRELTDDLPLIASSNY